MSNRLARYFERLAARLGDARSHRVVFLSHCLLNENTRYLGSVCHPGPVREVLDPWVRAECGIVQLPCPEQRAWGGVRKRWLLLSYDSAARAPWLYDLRRPLAALWLLYTRWAYARLARGIAADIADYVASGCAIDGIVGVDGSPSCGVTRTIDLHACMPLLKISPGELTVESQDAILRRAIRPGPGLFITALQDALARRSIHVHLTAHELFGNLDDQPTTHAPADGSGETLTRVPRRGRMVRLEH